MKRFLYVAALKFPDASNTFGFIVGFTHEFVSAANESDAYRQGQDQLFARKGERDPETGQNTLMNDYVVEIPR